MSQELNERTKAMMHEFVMLHDEGRTIPEIADRFKISPKTIYRVLEEIANMSGRSRDSLLQAPGKGKKMFGTTVSESKSTKNFVEIDDLKTHFANAINEVGEIIAKINDVLEKDETR